MAFDRRLLWAEFLSFFVILPILVAVLLPPGRMFTVLALSTCLGIVLLHLTPGFQWRELLQGRRRIPVKLILGVGGATALVSWGILSVTEPAAIFALLRSNPALWLTIMLLYPLVSALPQEVVFRPLFFRRYESILPHKPVALTLNAALFSLAHLLYWNWAVALMTFGGGIVFAWAYEVRRSFPLAVILHSVAGNVLFTFGMGMFFYSGNVVRPF
ncbi:CPBP family intramembrane glutamic endopeptidase [Celeribacter litoreus]|uniref:CPBP family intramembrane glutamic endopeptidase n=1 Tax=Celeribacter litoreus TaxID=2876714 RepID=UPI001CCD1861|nr:type II CAAX endopeptidase family protein [Celeribacter litoreus]MCA0043340.1 CPBP family intramembrane metalloprotease [Celeribacter litoreus]